MKICADVGREGCPCGLFPVGGCKVCSYISKGDCNQCNWSGACIYAMFKDAGKKTNAREEESCAVREMKAFGDSLRVIVISTSKGFCQEASKVGAFVFSRAAGYESWYDMPISVLKSEPDKGLLHLGVNLCGPKSYALCQSDEIVVRGVYRSGLLGIDTLKEEREKTIIYSKGIGIAPLRNMIDGGAAWGKYLKNMKIYIDLEKINLDFLKEYFGDIPCQCVEVISMKEIEFVEKEDENLIALVSPYYVEKIEETHKGEFVKPNNATLCCGEGVCGACTLCNDMGEVIHLCKEI